MKHRADVLSLGAALLFALAAALVGPIGDPDAHAVREPARALPTHTSSTVGAYILNPADLLVYLLLQLAPHYPPTEPHVYTLD